MPYTTINKSTDHFNIVLYTGNGTDNRTVTGVGFQPDWVWQKTRDGTSNHHFYDAVRGATKEIHSQNTDAEITSTNTLKSFDSDGFTVGTETNMNGNSSTKVAWNWKANGQGSSNTDGSINTTYTSANTTAGLSISKYTGTGSAGTIGHGLGAEPHVIIIKKLNSAEQWFSYHKPLGNTAALVLDTNAAKITDSGYWNSTTPTSSVFSVTSNGSNNASGDTYVAYCFAPKTGYSKYGSYTGNNGMNFIYTGFKPKWCMFKRTDSADNWKILDSARSTYNIMNKTFSADTGSAEATESDVYVDFLSNGIRLDGTNGAINANGGNYIFMAFGQTMVGSNNIPCTAR